MSQVENEPVTFTLAAKKYFGLKEGQNNASFAAEMKGLDAKDRLELAEGLQASGIVIKDFDDIKAKASGVVAG